MPFMEPDFSSGGAMDKAYFLTAAWAERVYTVGGVIAVIAGAIAALAVAANQWGSFAREELNRQANDPGAFQVTQRRLPDGNISVEMRPRGGQISPFVVLVPLAEQARLVNLVGGPSGVVPRWGMVVRAPAQTADGTLAGMRMDNPAVNPTNSAYATFTSQPSELCFGAPDGLPQVRMRLDPLP